MMKLKRRSLVVLLVTALTFSLFMRGLVSACTGITLRAKDGTVVYGRTLEWGHFDFKSRVMIIPRGCQFKGTTPQGQNGFSWTAKFGVVGIDVLEGNILADGMNETGLAFGLFYHPGYAKYKKFDPARTEHSISVVDLGSYILTQCKTIDEARAALDKVDVVAVVNPTFGFPPPVHAIITEPSGKAIVVEFLKGETVYYDAPLGVITNSPTYDWHMTNLRNYVNISPVAIPTKKISDLDFKPLGGGSGMIGLPGDFTPPSRFIRAVAFAQTARPTADGPETIYELFRILDNFNVPVGAAEGSDDAQGVSTERSATIWTTANDTRNKVLYYHTQHNRRVRKIDLKKIDFDGLGKEIVHLPLDRKKAQDIEDITPVK